MLVCIALCCAACIPLGCVSPVPMATSSRAWKTMVERDLACFQVVLLVGQLAVKTDFGLVASGKGKSWMCSC